MVPAKRQLSKRDAPAHAGVSGDAAPDCPRRAAYDAWPFFLAEVEVDADACGPD
jgi:hypothetical protein